MLHALFVCLTDFFYISRLKVVAFFFQKIKLTKTWQKTWTTSLNLYIEENEQNPKGLVCAFKNIR